MKAITFVTTGLQTLNAVELIAKLGISDVHLCVCADKPRTLFEIESLTGYFPWKNIYYIPGRKIALSSNLFVYNLMYLLFGLGRFYKLIFNSYDVIIGNDINPYFNAYVKWKRTEGNNVYLIDDGTGSINLNLNKNKYSALKHPRQKLMYRFLGIKSYKLMVDYFFTSFQKYQSFNNLQLIENNWAYLISNLELQKPEERVFFIGDPHVERGYLSQDQYIIIIETVRRTFECDILYLSRAMESEEKLNKIAKLIPVIRKDKPIELLMVESDYYPNKVIAFHSSALFSLNQIYGDKIEYFWMKLPSYTNQKHQDSLKSIWKRLEMFANEFKY